MIYSGRIEKMKLKGRSKNMYVVAYWNNGETYEDAVDYDMSKFELAADFVSEDLLLS